MNHTTNPRKKQKRLSGLYLIWRVSLIFESMNILKCVFFFSRETTSQQAFIVQHLTPDRRFNLAGGHFFVTKNVDDDRNTKKEKKMATPMPENRKSQVELNRQIRYASLKWIRSNEQKKKKSK